MREGTELQHKGSCIVYISVMKLPVVANITVSSEHIAVSCEPHMMAVNSPNIRPSRTISSVTTRTKVGDWLQSGHHATP